MKALHQALAFALALAPLLAAPPASLGAPRPGRRPAPRVVRRPPLPAPDRTPARSRAIVAQSRARTPARPAVSGPAPSPAPAPAPAPAPVGAAEIGRRVGELTNEVRAGAGLPPLAWDDGLAEVARRHAEDLAARGVVAHVVDGETPLDRVLDGGYPAAFVGENLFRAYPVAADPTVADGTVVAWMNSPDHRANLLDVEPTQVGVGVVLAPIPVDGVDVGLRDLYVVQVLARPAR